MVDIKYRLKAKAVKLILKDKLSEAIEILRQIMEVLES